MTKMGHIIVERREVGILVDADMSHALILQGAEHFRKAQYYHEMGEVTAASYQISCWHDCECWIALISGTVQPPPHLPKQSQFYFDGKNEAPQKEISEFDMLLSQLRESYPQRFARYLISISSNYRKACDLFYMGEITKAQVQLHMGWQMHKAMLQSENQQLIDPPRNVAFYFAPFINPEYNITAPMSRWRMVALSTGKIQAAAYFDVARQEYTTGRINTANYYLHKWWTELKEIANLEKTAFSEVLHTADYYFGNGDDVPPDAALVPRKPKPGADPTAGSLPLPKSNQ